MNKDTRNAIERATQRARKLLEDDFASQLEGTFDVLRLSTVALKAGGHLSPRQVFQRDKIVAAIEHKRAAGMTAADAVADYLRDAAFTTLNRFVALKMLEARELVQECITKGEQSAGYREFCGLAAGVALLPESTGYRLYIESLFDELSTEVKVLFDRRDPSSVLWPRRATFEGLLEILNGSELAGVWVEDETIGWVYQFFNGADERKMMREASQAPRNSRELAVRNQFFTPRYVVQFLTDNTLGRIWYEMRDTKTALADRCEYMVRKPDEKFAPRARKDPRDLRVLDPACGSGHFLLYAFDLFLSIYQEAYADSKSPNSEATGRTLAEDYPSLDALRKSVPGLVLAHNLHGVDIDPRCAQIAQLALWMRSQKAYRDLGIGRADRAQIRCSNIVVAEPLVADEQIAKEFVAKLGDAKLGRVFMSLVELLRLAGDLGLLLRVEQLVKTPAKTQCDLFAPPEARIRAALDRFVREEASATNTRRRLFADDAAHGVALLGVAEKKFDVVLMNPPFGQGSMRARKEFASEYPRTNDVYAAFVERGVELLRPRGRVGAITSRTGFFLSSFEEWRKHVLLEQAPPAQFADLGYGVLDTALVETVAFCLERTRSATQPSLFVDLQAVPVSEKARELAASVTGGVDAPMTRSIAPEEFRGLPGGVFAYWLSRRTRRLFHEHGPFERDGRTAKQGLTTSDDGRFVRVWWEVHSDSIDARNGRWAVFFNGGKYSPYYQDTPTVLRWHGQGEELRAFSRAVIRNPTYFLRAGISWPLRAVGFAPFPVPDNSVFSARSYLAAAPREVLPAMWAVMASRCFEELFRAGLSGARPNFVVGVIVNVPYPDIADELAERIGRLPRRAWALKRSVDLGRETSHAFVVPPCIDGQPPPALQSETVEHQIQDIQKQVDDEVFRLYGVGPEDRLAIEASRKRASAGVLTQAEDTDLESEDEDGDEVVAGTDLHAANSWLVGVAFGRFDPRLATGERAIPPEPEPFDPLPSRSPGMYPEGEEPANRPDILVDDEGHGDDLAARAVAFAERVKVDVPEDLRGWLAKEFFPLHIKMYSKSRRKAPIYWQLATPSASYSVWLYIHGFSKDTFFRVQNDYAAPKLAHEERRLESLASELRDGATATQRKALAAQQGIVEELRAFLEEVKRVAPLWNPNLDDGVIINFAPIWRLVPQNKAWQKELKATWDALCEGKYDWAHLAMHLWPERVVPTCAKDRSLAIAHGLADVFWVEGTNGKWTARKTPMRPIDELVRERTSPAVKAALKSLLEAPVAQGGSGRGGRGRAAASADEGSR